MRSKFLKVGIIISICVFFINLVFVNYLPNNIANQITMAGTLTTYTSKYVFMISLPLLEILISIYLYYKKEIRIWYYVAVFIIFIFCDVAIIVTNLIFK